MQLNSEFICTRIYVWFGFKFFCTSIMATGFEVITRSNFNLFLLILNENYVQVKVKKNRDHNENTLSCSMLDSLFLSFFFSKKICKLQIVPLPHPTYPHRCLHRYATWRIPCVSHRTPTHPQVSPTQFFSHMEYPYFLACE